MIYIGITEEHDCGVAIVNDGELIFAAAEERYIRKKFPVGFPTNAFKDAVTFLRNEGLHNEDIKVCFGSIAHVENIQLRSNENFLYDVSHSLIKFANKFGVGSLFLGSVRGAKLLTAIYSSSQSRRRRNNQELTKTLLTGLKLRGLVYHDHHLSHASSAYYTSGFNTCLTFTLDAAGDGFCSKAYLCSDGKMQVLQETPLFHSIGYYYYLITLLLGFKIGQEGKITGLAARGDYLKTKAVLEKFIKFDHKKGTPVNHRKAGFHEFDDLKKALESYSREDIAAGIQKLTEEIVLKWIEHIGSKFFVGRNFNIALAGGVFANVLLNQKINQLPRIKKVYIFPSMGDGGLCVGSALYQSQIELETKAKRLNTAYLGPEFSDAEIECFLIENKCSYVKCENIQLETAKRLARGKIVARYNGRMEFGPRSLGHRSILCPATERKINEVLNEKLQRSEFMPFAPAISAEHSEEYFALEQSTHACEFMTITCHAKSRTLERFPAIVHIDGTARPQVVHKTKSPDFHEILKSYYDLTGNPILINTSFNIHEEPIVLSPSDAIKTFKAAKLDYLSIGSFLVKNND